MSLSGVEPRMGALDPITISGKNGAVIARYEECRPLYSIKQYSSSIYYVVKFKRSSFPSLFGLREAQKVNDRKLDNAYSRARSMIRQYGLCNPWDYFVTLTLDPTKYKRDDLDKFHKDIMQWIRDERKRIKGKYPEHDKKLSVLLVPENHKDGAWHMHGLLYGLPEPEITDFIPGVHPQKLINGNFRNWPRYAKKFGFCSLGRIRDQLSTVLYTTKYIAKDVPALAERKGKNLYFASKPLATASTVAHAYVPIGSLDALLTYHGEFCSTGMGTNMNWTFLIDDDIEVVVDEEIANPGMLLEPLMPAQDFDPVTIDPTYEQLTLF